MNASTICLCAIAHARRSLINISLIVIFALFFIDRVGKNGAGSLGARILRILPHHILIHDVSWLALSDGGQRTASMRLPSCGWALAAPSFVEVLLNS